MSGAAESLADRGAALAVARKAVALERRRNPGLMLAQEIADALIYTLALMEPCRVAPRGPTCAEQGLDPKQLCSSCRALHHASGLEAAIRDMREGSK